MSLGIDALTLIFPAALGALAGRVGLFAERSRAVDDLNRYALYFAFPALIFRGLVDASFTPPSSPGFWLLVPLAYGVGLGLARLLARREAGTLALVLGFGNVAYLGLPIVESALGAEALGLASLAVAIHVTLGLSLGPFLLLRWSERSATSALDLRRLLRQPLVWTPLVAFAARALPEPLPRVLEGVTRPLGLSAAPVALFLLGLYLYDTRVRPGSLDRGDLAHLGAKLVLLPALTLSGAFVFRRVGWLELGEAQVLVLLSAMPAGITTFALAREFGTGAERTSRAIVTTTLLSLVVLPAVVWLVLSGLPSWG